MKGKFSDSFQGIASLCHISRSGAITDVYVLTAILVFNIIYEKCSIAGLDYVLVSSRASLRPSIVSMSLGGGANLALDKAVRKLTSQGVHVAVAAGNDNKDAAGTSPAREPSAVTVGASTIGDERAFFSNFGSVVDIFAPGRFVISAWIDNDTVRCSFVLRDSCLCFTSFFTRPLSPSPELRWPRPM